MRRWMLGAAASAAVVALIATVLPRAQAQSLQPAAAADHQEGPIDVNSAAEEQLRTLPGVGPARARAVVAGRPYSGKDDLLKRNILPKNVYDGIKDRIIAEQK